MEEVLDEILASLEENPGTANADVQEISIGVLEETDEIKIDYSFVENFSQRVIDSERQIEAIEEAYSKHGYDVDARYKATGLYEIKGGPL